MRTSERGVDGFCQCRTHAKRTVFKRKKVSVCKRNDFFRVIGGNIVKFGELTFIFCRNKILYIAYAVSFQNLDNLFIHTGQFRQRSDFICFLIAAAEQILSGFTGFGQKFIEVFGTKVILKGSIDKGTIQIDYFSKQDLNRLYNVIAPEK